MKVLVTGGTGFLGSYIIKELIAKGHQVRAIRRSATLPFWIDKTILDKAEWVEGDILDVVSLDDAMDGMDAVIHSAAIVSFLKKDRKAMQQVNVDGTTHVVDMALEKGLKRMVYISSVAALGRNELGGVVDETKKWEETRSNTHYARTKFNAEMQVWRGIGEGLEAVILNPSTILGYGDWHNSSCAIFKTMYEGFKWYSPGLNGFVDVEDVARAAVQMLESAINGERFIVNGDNWPFRRLMDTMAEEFGSKKPSKPISKAMLGIAWRIEKIKSAFTGKKPLLTRESARVAMSKTGFSAEKIQKALPGFTFTPLGESLKKACAQYKAAAKH